MAVDSEFEKALAIAKKALGPNAKVPHAKMDEASKASEERNKRLVAFHKHRDEFEKLIAEEKKTVEHLKKCYVAAETEIEKSNFSLDEKSENNKKRIDAARIILGKYFDYRTKWCDNQEKAITEIDKHIMNISHYKP